MTGLLIATACLLACQDLFDSDVWWHVRAGQWIWASGKVPALDPFTFASADRLWVDLHWLFQLMLAAAHAIAGVRGMILLTAAICAAVMLIAVTTRARGWPVAMSTACWLPALAAMSARFDPRPEVLSLLGLAVYLAILFRFEQRPALAWLLPVVQVIWVNTHALFVLGPIVLGAYAMERIACAIMGAGPPSGLGRRHFFHLGGAALAVAAACVVNPYGLRGALFPFELWPKITSAGGLYKSYVGEFMDLRTFVSKLGPERAAADFFFDSECFLLVLLPLSFIVPAVWRVRRVSPASATAGPAALWLWPGIFGLCAALAAARIAGAAAVGVWPWLAWLAAVVPAAFCLLGLGAAIALMATRSGTSAAILAAVGGAAEAAWAAWLGHWLFGPEPGLLFGGLTAVLGLAMAISVARAQRGQGMWRLILALAFGYLALSAVRNVNLFGLVAGFVLAWNLGEWAATMIAEPGGAVTSTRIGAAMALTGRSALIGVLVVWIVAIVSGRFFAMTGEQRAFGLRESPLAYAHDAARFAGRPGLPERALALDLRQAGVYLFHNGPDRKLYIDGRLEVPRRETFESFVRLGTLLRDGRPGWAEPLRRLGDPLLLLSHEDDAGAEATLLADQAWRCVYFDAIASIFVAQRSPASDASFPSVDFAARHFRDPAGLATPVIPWGLAEARAFFRLGEEIRRRPPIARNWNVRASLMLLACDRLRRALAQQAEEHSGPDTAALWTLMGNGVWNMVPDLSVAPPGADEPWDPARALLPCQAACCYRRALESNPVEVGALLSLHDLFRARRMRDAQQSVVEQMRQARQSGYSSARLMRDQSRAVGDAPPAWQGPDEVAHAIAALADGSQTEAAVRLFLSAEAQGHHLAWPLSDRVAAALLHLGRPREARQVWEHAQNPPSPALRLARMAACASVAIDHDTAVRELLTAVELDPGLTEAWFMLALLHTQLGQAERALAAARNAERQSPTAAQAAFLADIAALAEPYAADQEPLSRRSQE